MPFADPPAPPSPKSPRPTLLTLPLELRLKIFTLALLPSHRPSPTSRSPFSLLLTCRAIHHTTRHLPTELYPITFAYDSSRPHLSQLLPGPLRHEWQIAHLRRLAITWLYPSQLPVFLGLKKNEEEEKKKKKVIAAESGGGGKLNDESSSPPSPSAYLFSHPHLNLDILTLYTDDWMTRASASAWRRAADPQVDIHAGIPGPDARWLVALCGLRGFRQVEVVFAMGPMRVEYWERGLFVGGLMEGFREGMRALRRERKREGERKKGGFEVGGRQGERRIAAVGEMRRDEEEEEVEVPEWTVWHKSTPGEYTYERVTVLKTAALRRHGWPQWGKGDADGLREGGRCVGPMMGGGEVDLTLEETERPTFHVKELRGRPGGRRVVCDCCAVGDGKKGGERYR